MQNPGVEARKKCQIRENDKHGTAQNKGTVTAPLKLKTISDKPYDTKRKYTPKEEGDNAGESPQLVPGVTFLLNPIKL